VRIEKSDMTYLSGVMMDVLYHIFPAAATERRNY